MTKKQGAAAIAAVVAVIAILAIAWVSGLFITKTNPPPPPEEPHDVAYCVHRGLVLLEKFDETARLDIAARAKEATDAKVGIQNQKSREVLQQALSDAAVLKIIDDCAAQYVDAVPLFMPMVKAVEQGTHDGVAYALIDNGATYERCPAGTDGRCQIIISSRRAGGSYQLDATCEGNCMGYSPGHQTFTVEQLKSGNVLEVPMPVDQSTLTFVVTRNGAPLDLVEVAPDTSKVHFTSKRCFDAHRTGDECGHEVTLSGAASFHFNQRPSGDLHVVLTPKGEKPVTKTVAIPGDGLRIAVALPGPAAEGGHTQDPIPH